MDPSGLTAVQNDIVVINKPEYQLPLAVVTYSSGPSHAAIAAASHQVSTAITSAALRARQPHTGSSSVMSSALSSIYRALNGTRRSQQKRKRSSARGRGRGAGKRRAAPNLAD